MHVVPGVTHAAYGTALPFVSFGGFTAFTMESPRNPAVELNVQAAQLVLLPAIVIVPLAQYTPGGITPPLLFHV